MGENIQWVGSTEVHIMTLRHLLENLMKREEINKNIFWILNWNDF